MPVTKYGTDLPDTVPHDPNYANQVLARVPKFTNTTPAYGGFSTSTDDASQKANTSAVHQPYMDPTPNPFVQPPAPLYHIGPDGRWVNADTIPVNAIDAYHLAPVTDPNAPGYQPPAQDAQSQSVDPSQAAAVPAPVGPQSNNPPNIVYGPLTGQPIDLSPRGTIADPITGTGANNSGVIAQNGQQTPGFQTDNTPLVQAQANAIDAQTAAQVQAAKDQATLQDQINGRRQVLLDSFTRDQDALHKQGMDLYNKIASSKIDPNQFWEQQGPGSGLAFNHPEPLWVELDKGSMAVAILPWISLTMLSTITLRRR